jgi:UTP--glucose-1-phosphate uridylyltransferase
MAVRTAVIPAAGFGTRFLPITKAVPKEMLPLVDRPILQYAVEEALNAGIDRIILVTSRGKALSEDYFDLSSELERSLEAKESPRLKEIRHISRMADIIAVRQHEPLGLGHAVLTARRAVGDEFFAVMLADDVIQGSPTATQQLLQVFDRYGSVVAVEEVPTERISAYGMVGGESVTPDLWRINQIIEKPPAAKAPSNMGVVGRYVFTPAIFDCLEQITTGAIGELQLTDAIALLSKQEPVHAYRFTGTRYDCGTPVGLLKASVELALERPEFSVELQAWLKELAARLG